jgi:NAD(P)-dependent dehydrogenase (short-subunit alcohol dehydrogenase family)
MTTHVLLTGASRGIGAAIAEMLRNRDVKLFAASSSDADLSCADGPSLLWQEALVRLDGKVDVLINNAGIFEESPLDSADEAWLAQWRRTMTINLEAAAVLSRSAILAWQSAGVTGRIVNIASRAAYRGDSPAHWHYAASKAGMVAFTKTIARGYACDDILAFAICPGFTETGMAEDYLASRGGERLLAEIPLGRVAKPAEIATIAAFLSLDAPASMTGAVLDANGASYVR